MKERMIFNDILYRFEFLDETKKQMLLLGMTIEDIKDAFFNDEEQNEHFSGLSPDSCGTFVYSNTKDRTFVIKKDHTILNITNVW
ncbi:hypothetical protein [uncultured Tissierella sp.]|uniref:hypothetical protein n=1 Tax=uncultured Tissierella sp. TaxID=448160 RepID=UPI002805549C|nr:hypothetical protein [uncultured Tissierella sp.]MDU5082841.1 hypothetical protein [Bacillota bacterium]